MSHNGPQFSPIKATFSVKDAARSAMTVAIQNGKLRRAATCESCGKSPSGKSKLHGHHEDYAKPLDVKWLCCLCHGRRHAELNRAPYPTTVMSRRVSADLYTQFRLTELFHGKNRIGVSEAMTEAIQLFLAKYPVPENYHVKRA